MGMKDALGSLDDGTDKLARLGLVLDMNALVTSNENGDIIPRDGAADMIKYLLENQITFVVIHNGVKISEKRVAHNLNKALDLPKDLQIPFSNALVGTSPLRTALGSQIHNPDDERVILVIGGSGDQSRRLARDYGFPYVVTTAEITRFYDAFSHYHNPANDAAAENAPLEAGWRLRRRNKHIKIEGILVFWEPQNWELDADVVTHILVNCGRLGYDCSADNAALTPAQLADKIARNMPPLHICMADLVSTGPSASGDWPGRTWLRFLQERWIKRTNNMPWLEYTLYGPGVDHALLRCAEWTLTSSDRRAYAKSVGKDPDADEMFCSPRVSYVYTVGIALEGKFNSGVGARWRDVVIRGQEMGPSGPRRPGARKVKPEFVAGDLGEAVEYALTQAYSSSVEAGLEPMWPAPNMNVPRVEEGMHPKRVEEMDIEDAKRGEKETVTEWMEKMMGWMMCCGGRK
ncbi:hypothetical protein QBC34DRAFT_440174 [Podospora aff. communis PSN243]|uniref:Uncharacterized protein n=1 Tax=Podospora aff. communis PSN243 TaxID=3040156 RepID=A0AAV9GGY3_9PEZI|nr:hypothetical protein QBC34DRAFT_440174 [Podospora aff. communis PSN243]